MPSHQSDEQQAEPKLSVDDRLDELMEIIKQDREIAPEAISEKMNVSLRTVYRYLRRLRQSELLKTRYSRKHKKHFLQSTENLRPIRFTPQEALALEAASSGAERQTTSRLTASLYQALKKINEATDIDLDTAAEQGFGEFGVIDEHTRRNIPAYHDIILALSHAYDDRNKVQLRYWQLGNSRPEEMVVHPLHIALNKGVWYLMAFSERHGETRLFQIALIDQAVVMTERFRKPSKMDASLRFERCLSDAKSDVGPQVILRFSAKVAEVVKQLTGVRLHIEQVMTDGCLICSLEPYGSGEMMPWILGWGVEVEVLQPDGFRRDLARVAATLLRRYSAALSNQR
ncbi:MAG: helix-turn-helix transcriptional regulator [Armatimonadota bacterium]